MRCNFTHYTMPLAFNKISRSQKVKFFAHLMVICIIFFLPEFLQQYGRPHNDTRMMLMPYIKAMMYVGIFYLNYFVLLDRTIFSRHKRLWLFIGCNLLLVAMVFFFNYLEQRHWIEHYGQFKHRHRDLPAMVLMMREWAFYLRDFIMIVFTVGLSVALKFSYRWSAMEKRHREMEMVQRAAELESLKSQLNPHFLFNTLNTIYSLIEISPKEAQDAVHQLSKLLRYMLYENPATVRLSQEIDFARSYISLMEMRIGQGMVVADFSGADGNDVMVAPLLFFTLIENACKHGNTGKRADKIQVTLTCSPDGVVECRTVNHFIPEVANTRQHKGIGLQNLHRRLDLLYGTNAQLETKTEGDVFTATLCIKVD